MCHSDLLLLIAIKFDEKSLVCKRITKGMFVMMQCRIVSVFIK